LSCCIESVRRIIPPLGPATGMGNEMCQWVLKANGNVVPRRTVTPLTHDEIHSPNDERRRRVFDQLIEKRFGKSVNASKDLQDSPTSAEIATEEEETWEPYTDEEEPAHEVHDMDDAVDARGLLINQQPEYDQFLNLELQLNNGQHARVARRVVGPSGERIGAYDDQPMLNTIMYEVEFDDGQVKEYGATSIAENILAQVDDDGFSSSLLQAIIDYCKDRSVAVSKRDRPVEDRNGRKRLRKTTKGWQLKVKWSDGSTSWLDLKILKESNPVDVAEFAIARRIDDEPAFV